MGVLKNDVGRPKNKTIMIRTILKGITIIIVGAGLLAGGYYLNKYQQSQDKKGTKQEKKSEWLTPKGNAGKVYIFYDKKFKGLQIASDEDSLRAYRKDKDKQVKYTYSCNKSSCRGSRLYEKLGYALIKDDGYILYDYAKNLYKKIILKNVDEEYEYLNLLPYDGKIYGYVVMKGDESAAIYNLELEKLVTDFKYWGNENTYNEDIPELYDGNFIAYGKEEDSDDTYTTSQYLIDLKTGKEKFSAANSYDNATGVLTGDVFYMRAIGNKGNIYYIKEYGYDVSEAEICDENFEPIINGKYNEYGINSKGNIVVDKGTKFSIYNKKGSLIKNSKEYKQIIAIDYDYVAILDNDNYIKVVDYDGKVLAKFIEVTKDIEIHPLLSGWYGEDGKEGMYVVVEDTSIEEGTQGRGAEYYYEPKTKKTGVIKLKEIGGYAKPVLYLYPTRDNTKVDITFGNDKVLKTTYPKYNGKWSVTANRNGDLIDNNGKKYYALYWDETTYKKVSFDEGFYVTKDNAIDFLEEKLDQIGLNYKEKNEFIMYWLPILESNGRSLVYFELTNSRESFNKLNINPTPDSLLRVAIHIKKVDKKVNIKKQKLPKFERNGFTAIEWGGVNY